MIDCESERRSCLLWCKTSDRVAKVFFVKMLYNPASSLANLPSASKTLQAR